MALWLLPSASSARPDELEEVLNEIHALFDWNPPALIPEEKKKVNFNLLVIHLLFLKSVS